MSTVGLIFEFLAVVLVLLAGVAVPKPVFDNAVRTAYVETADAYGKSAAYELFQKSAARIPYGLRVAPQQAPNTLRRSVGGFASFITGGATNGQVDIKAHLLRIALVVLVLVPLRAVAVSQYLALCVLLIAGAGLRKWWYSGKRKYNLILDVSGNLAPPKSGINWGWMLALTVIPLLLVPLPVPVWVAAAAAIAAALAPWGGRAGHGVPKHQRLTRWR